MQLISYSRQHSIKQVEIEETGPAHSLISDSVATVKGTRMKEERLQGHKEVRRCISLMRAR